MTRGLLLVLLQGAPPEMDITIHDPSSPDALHIQAAEQLLVGVGCGGVAGAGVNTTHP